MKKATLHLRIITSYGVDGGNRTHMVSRRFLRPVRIPISPHRHIFYKIRRFTIMLDIC